MSFALHNFPRAVVAYCEGLIGVVWPLVAACLRDPLRIQVEDYSFLPH